MTPELARIGERDILPELYELSRLISGAETALSILPRVVNLIRKIFIFDNMIIYLAEGDELSPYFARAVGRGRSNEAEIAWGLEIATNIYETGETKAKREELEGAEENRLFLRYYLGIPLKQGSRKIGAVVFIRFDGPVYDLSQISLAEFIAEHFAYLLEREQLNSKVNSLVTGQKLDEIQENFVSTVSHDLRTPLGFIKGYTTTLLREDAEWDRATTREFLEIINDEADRLRILIDNLLDSSRLQSGALRMQFQNISLDIVLRDVVSRAEVFGFDSPVKFNIPSSKMIINVDPARISQVFDNLFSNAIKYAPKSKLTLTSKQENDKAHIIVSDTGPGIGAEHLEKIFDRFYRVPGTNGGGRGSGLGLFICRQIIDAHHGKIWAESILGEGTTFHIYLPLVG